MSLATLDLGALGEQIDAALQDADLDITDEDAAAPEGSGESVESAGDDQDNPPAAGAGDDFEARYRERFALDYAEKSRKDIGNVRSGLDRQITTLKRAQEDLQDRADEADLAVGYLLQQLREYDPEAATRFEQGRPVAQKRLVNDRKLERIERQQVEDTRGGWYAAAFPDGAIAADDPQLLAAQKVSKDFEREVLELKVKALGLAWDPAKGHFVPEAARAVPQAKAEAEPKGELVRNEKGQFVSQQVAATRQREAERGKQPSLGRTAVAEKAATTIEEGRDQLMRGLKNLGLN